MAQAHQQVQAPVRNRIHRGTSHIIRYCRHFNEPSITILNIALQIGGNVNHILTQRKMTPLCLAAINGHPTTVRWLVQNGANVDYVNNQRINPLGHAIRFLLFHLRIGSGNIQADGRTLEDIALERIHILLQAGSARCFCSDENNGAFSFESFQQWIANKMTETPLKPWVAEIHALIS